MQNIILLESKLENVFSVETSTFFWTCFQYLCEKRSHSVSSSRKKSKIYTKTYVSPSFEKQIEVLLVNVGAVIFPVNIFHLSLKENPFGSWSKPLKSNGIEICRSNSPLIRIELQCKFQNKYSFAIFAALARTCRNCLEIHHSCSKESVCALIFLSFSY